MHFESWRTLGSLFASSAHSVEPEESVIANARLEQHQGILLYQVGNLAASRTAMERADAIMRDLGYTHGLSNNYQYLGRIALEGETGSLDDAIERLQLLEAEFGVIAPVDEWIPGQTHTEFWTGVALMCLKAEVDWRRKRLQAANELTASVASLLRRKRVKVMEVFHDPHCIPAFCNRFSGDGQALAAFAKPPTMCAEFHRFAEVVRGCVQRIAIMRQIDFNNGTT